MTQKLRHHECNASLVEGDNGPDMLFEQSYVWSGDESRSVNLHPHQLR